MKAKLKSTALKLNKLGLKIIPTGLEADGKNKRPLHSWKKYQEKQTKEDIEYLFKSTRIGGIALITGQGIEVIDVDLKYAKNGNFLNLFLDALIDNIGEECFDKLILTKTRNNGYHIIYKTDVKEGNQKLASRNTTKEERKNEHDKVRVLLETRAEGGYILIPPTEGYEYDNPSKSLTCIQHITDKERNMIISVCKLFDETKEYFEQKSSIPVEVAGSHLSTIESFNSTHTPKELIEQNGWVYDYKRGMNSYYIRPGKSKGIGASYEEEKKLLYVFTSSSIFEPNRAYSAFQTYACLEHSGDYKAAAKQLYAMGYGDRLSKNRDTYQDKLTALTSSNVAQREKASNFINMKQIFQNRFSIHNVPEKVEDVLFLRDFFSQKNVPIASWGDWITIVGAAKSRKSALSNSIAASFLANAQHSVLNFIGHIKDRNIIILDTEQNAPDYYKSQKQIYKQAEIPKGVDPKNFFSFCLTEYRISERLEFIEYVMNSVGNVGLLVLDGIVDICQDYNDQKISRKLIDHLKVLTAKHKTIMIPVLHNARSTGSARGHLGTELINKSKAVINVKKDKELQYSTVEFEYIRGASEPSDFKFEHNEDGELVLSYI